MCSFDELRHGDLTLELLFVIALYPLSNILWNWTFMNVFQQTILITSRSYDLLNAICGSLFCISHYSYSICSDWEYFRKIPLMLIVYVTISNAVRKLYCNIINQIKLCYLYGISQAIHIIIFKLC